MSKKYRQHLRNPALELMVFQRDHTFDPDCVCGGKGHRGIIKHGERKGLYVPCSCAKLKIRKDVQSGTEA